VVEPGKRLGPYLVDSRIGAGGMGEVWKARDTRLDRSVAIKVLPAELAHSAQFKLRFDREAKTISQLNHPHICTLYDVGDNYLVMELLDGESLAERIARGPLPMAEVLKYGTQIADALDKAHRQGVVHRDLKPGNVMITKSGAKLLDFGLAKSTALAVNVDGATEHKPLTQEGTILGTFQYMAPEQLEGLEADARTDIFAFGALLYEMATGVRAFEGKTKTSLIAAIVKDEPRAIREIQPLTPPALEHVVMKCLTKDPDERWQSAHDIAEELRWIGEAGSQAGMLTPQIATHRNARERIAWSIAVLALLAAAAIAAKTWLRPRTQPAMTFAIPGYDAGYQMSSFAIVSPDGRRFAFAARGSADRPRMLFVRDLANPQARALEGTENPNFFTWSTDSRRILYSTSAKLMMIDPDGGPPQQVAETPDVWGMAMSSEGVALIGSGRSGLSKTPPKGGTPEVLTKLDPSRHEVAHYAPHFVDEKHFVFLVLTRVPGKRNQVPALYAGSLDSKEVKRVGDIPSVASYVDSGHLLFVREGSLMAVKFDPDAATVSGEPVTIANNLFYFHPAGAAEFSASRNGVVTYRSAIAGSPLAWLDQTGARLGTVGPNLPFDAFVIAPDGQSVVAEVTDPKIGTSDLWNFGFKRGTATRLTFDPGWEGSPVLTPDGKRLFYASDRVGIPDIFVKELGSADDDRPVVVAPGEQYASDVSPDGKYLLYASAEYDESGEDLYVLALDDGKAKAVRFVRSPFNERNGRFSPDGTMIAYQSNESGSYQVYVKPFPGPGQARQISTAGGQDPRWSRDGKQLYFRHIKKVFAVDMSVPDQEPRQLFELSATIGNMEPAADGRFLADVLSELAATRPTHVIVNWQSLLR
jgi:eukaryotic-like serine/threonine-protein kinase